MNLNPAVERAELHESFGAEGVPKTIRRTRWVRLHFFETSCIQSIRTLQTPSTAESRLKHTGSILRRGFRAVVSALWVFLVFEILMIGLIQKPVSQWLQGRGLAQKEPDVIVVLGGGGIPSESGLIRCYTGALLALEYPEAVCVVSLPADGDAETNSVGRMKEELVLRGVSPDRVLMEDRALNTRQQADAVLALLESRGVRTQQVALVTSPLHIRRSLMSFEAAGFQRLQPACAYSTGAEADIGPGGFFRYTCWMRLEDQVNIFRELTAIAWYRLRGFL